MKDEDKKTITVYTPPGCTGVINASNVIFRFVGVEKAAEGSDPCNLHIDEDGNITQIPAGPKHAN